MTGRPRDPEADDAILHAAFALAADAGYRSVSIEAIAARAGVSKQTVYRRYRGKGEIMLDALAAFAAGSLPMPDTGSLRDDLRALLTATFEAQQGASGMLNQAVAVEALQDPEFTRLLWERLTLGRRDAVRAIIQRAADREEVKGVDHDLLIDLTFGPMWYWLIFDRTRLDAEYAKALSDAVVAVATAAKESPGGAGVAP